MAIGSPLSPVISNMGMENFKKVALEQGDLRHKIWLRYVMTYSPFGHMANPN
jgi:hypothetical protein